MKRIRKFFTLPTADRSLLITSAIWIIGVRLALHFLSFQRVRNTLNQYGRKSGEKSEVSAEDVIWAVNIVSRYLLPKKPCLTKALVAQMLLGRMGYETALRIGVARTVTGGLQAHAWLERQGRIVIGHLDNLALFTPLPPMEIAKL